MCGRYTLKEGLKEPEGMERQKSNKAPFYIHPTNDDTNGLKEFIFSYPDDGIKFYQASR